MEKDEEKQEDKDIVMPKRKRLSKVVEAELKISMHCNACERSVAKAIAKFKGVEKFITDMRRHRVVITGKIDPEKVRKKLKKRTGKQVELVPPPKQEPAKVVDDTMESHIGQEGEALMNELVLFGGSHWRGCDFTTMFSDENPNACLIM